MKKSQLFFAILYLIVFPLSMNFAAFGQVESIISSISLELPNGNKVILKRSPMPNSILTQDTLFLIPSDGKPEKAIFVSRGEVISNLKTMDLKKNGEPQILVTTLSYGSGGYGDVVLLEKKFGEYNEIWSDTFVNPTVNLVKDISGITKLSILHFTKISDGAEEIPVISIFKPSANSTLELEANINPENVPQPKVSATAPASAPASPTASATGHSAATSTASNTAPAVISASAPISLASKTKTEPTPIQAKSLSSKNIKSFFPALLKSGLLLQKVEQSERPLVFLDKQGWEAIYALDEKKEESKVSVVVLEMPDEKAASDTFNLMSNLDNINEKKIKSLPPFVRAFSFKQGVQDSPAASADAKPIASTKVVALFPSVIMFLTAYRDDVSETDIIQILEEFGKNLNN
ncbi:MAG: hypothetical protein HQM08_11580 [Candidatus Riflebacteria bacterium]|nr:hypothetical protein [Candidatus Riflebacteria bacterium]